MRVSEYKQTGTETITEQMPVLDEDGNETGEFETVTREVPVMQMVYRDMTPEEEAEALEQQRQAEEYERTRPRTVEEKLDALMEYMGVKGIWNGQVFEVVKDTEHPSGDYLNPIAFTAPMMVELGRWYFADDPQLPAECVQAGLADSYGAPWLDVVG